MMSVQMELEVSDLCEVASSLLHAQLYYENQGWPERSARVGKLFCRLPKCEGPKVEEWRQRSHDEEYG